MVTAFADPFDALFNLQTAVEARSGSEWLQNQTASQGQFPPTNVFTQGDGVNKNDLQTQDALTVILEDVEKTT